MLNIFGGKKGLRAQLIEKRKRLPETDCLCYSRAIEKRLMTSREFALASTIHCYLSDRFEIQTNGLIRAALQLGKRVIVPAGIRAFHPQCVKLVSPEEIDLWIIPAVACDTMGHRLGRGGGYYDRLLFGCVGKTICLAFEFQIVDVLPFEQTDKDVDMIVTEDRIINCGINTPCPLGAPLKEGHLYGAKQNATD
jgi:5-formyltetrahydrofolate cyclo-ligase